MIVLSIITLIIYVVLELTLLNPRLKSIFGAIVIGVLVSLATGLITSSEITIPEIKHYGYPLFWRVTDLNGPTEYVLSNLVLDTTLWVAVSLISLIVLEIVVSKFGMSNYKTLLLPLALFIPLGLVMDFIHEFGHTIWGTAVGGRLTYLQVAYFKIYPQLAIIPQFN